MKIKDNTSLIPERLNSKGLCKFQAEYYADNFGGEEFVGMVFLWNKRNYKIFI